MELLRINAAQRVTIYNTGRRDINGNPIYYVPFGSFITDEEAKQFTELEQKELATIRAKAANYTFRKTTSKKIQFGFYCQGDFRKGADIENEILKSRKY